MAETPYTFTEDGARRIAAAVKRIESSGTADVGNDVQSFPRRASCYIKLGTVIAHPLWNGSEVVADGTGGFSDPAYGARAWNSTTPLLVLGVPESQLVVGMVLRANCLGTSVGSSYWIAEGYERRVLDWGTGGSTPPWFVQDFIPKVRTLKTTNGYTWTAEVLNFDGGPCE